MTHPSYISNFKKIYPFLGGVILVTIGVILVNVLVDQKGIYSLKDLESKEELAYFHQYATKLIQSKTPQKTKENERLVKYYLGDISDSPTYVMGSSRAFQIRSSLLNEQSTANLAISGGSFEDFILLLGMLLSKETTPKKIYLSIDPWFFSENAHIRYLDFPRLYQKSLKSFPTFPQGSSNNILWLKVKNMISKDYFLYNIGSVFQKSKPRNPFEGSVSWTDNLYNSDGSLTYSPAYENMHKVLTLQLIESGLIYKSNSLKVNPAIVKKFEIAIQTAQHKGITFVFILLPYHRSVYLKSYQDLKENLLSVLSTVKTIAKDLKITLWGSYFPDDYPLSDQDFYDGIHLKASGIQKVLKPIGQP